MLEVGGEALTRPAATHVLFKHLLFRCPGARTWIPSEYIPPLALALDRCTLYPTGVE